jgi:hypothetical protein
MSISFLSEIWRRPGYGELRMIRKGRDGRPEIRQSWHELNDTGLGLLSAADLALRSAAEGWDVYYGVVPRTGHGGTLAYCLPDVDVLWADVDAKNFNSKDEAYASIMGYRVSPSAMVDSGNGYHLYWIMKTPVPAADATTIMKGIAKAIGGDAVSDLPRVLRIPGTTNWKREPIPVRLIAMDSRRRRSISDFAQELEAARFAERPRRVQQNFAPVPMEKLPRWLQDIIIAPAPKGARSEAAFKACLWLSRYGWTDEQIESAFANNPHGVGEKYAERRDGSRWLSTTLRAARNAR